MKGSSPPGRGRAKGPRRAPAAAAAVEASTAAAESVSKLETTLGYAFQNQELPALALTHSSFIYEARLGRAKANGDEPNQPGTDNEQLEFLGDAVLGLAITELLLREFPDRSEGELTRMRAALVSRKRMAELGETLGLGDLLRMGRSAESGDGRQKPAVLANTAEAVLGAVYLDVSRGSDARARTGERALRLVREIVQRMLLQPDLAGIRAEVESSSGRGALRDAKSRLQERVQAERLGRLFYADIEESGPAHARHFSVEARLEGVDGKVRTLAAAEGPSKKEAQQAAAAIALNGWDNAKSPSPAAARVEVQGHAGAVSSAPHSTAKPFARNGAA